MKKILQVPGFVFFMLILFGATLSAHNNEDLTTTFIHRFSDEKKVYVLLDKGMCFEVVGDTWKCDNWLPGDPIKIERLAGYSTFDFSIVNLSTNRKVYAKFAYVAATEVSGSDNLKGKVDDLEKRVAFLERLVLGN